MRFFYRQGALFLVMALLLMTSGVSVSNAQMVYLDDIPFFAPADSTSRLALVTDFNRFEDSKFNWSVNRLLVSIILPAGEKSTFFVRMPFTSFDSGSTPAFSRWPWVEGPAGGDGWPNSYRVTSLGQPEIGATGPAGLQKVPNLHYGLALGLPAGSDRLYPFGSVGMPLRLDLRKYFPLRKDQQIGLTLGYLLNMASTKDFLAEDEAFPSGIHLGGVYHWYRSRNSHFSLAYDYHNRDGRISQLLGVQAWAPFSADGSVGLKVSRELQGSLDRTAAWFFTISFRIDSQRYRPSEQDSEVE